MDSATPLQVLGPDGVGKRRLIIEALKDLPGIRLNEKRTDTIDGSLWAVSADAQKTSTIIRVGTRPDPALGGRLLRVRRLTATHATELFTHVARLARTSSMSKPDAEAVRALVQRLDRLPGAIVRHAKRVSFTTAGQLLQTMDDEELVTERVRKDVHSLPEELLRALSGLVIFQGGFSTHAAAEVLHATGIDGASVAHLLEALVERSIVDVRFDLQLPHYECLRAPLAALALKASDEARAAHSIYYQRTANRWHEEFEMRQGLRSISEAHRNGGNLRVAADACRDDTQAAIIWLVAGEASLHYGEYETAACDLTQCKMRSSSRDVTGKAELALARIQMRNMSLKTAKEHLVAASPESLITRCHIALAHTWCSWAIGERDHASLDEARRLVGLVPSQRGRLLIHEALMEPNLDDALVVFERAEAALDEAGLTREVPTLVRFRGVMLLIAGRRDEARIELERCIAGADDFDPVASRAAAFYLACVDALDGRFSCADVNLERLCADTASQSPPQAMLRTLTAACVLCTRGAAAARPHLDAAAAAGRGRRDPRRRGGFLALEPAILHAEGRRERAAASVAHSREEIATYAKPVGGIFAHLLELVTQLIDGRPLRWFPDRTRALPEAHVVAAALVQFATHHKRRVLKVALHVYTFDDHPSVDLSRRKALRQIMKGLVEASEPLDVDTLFELGWPGETAMTKSQAQRVYTALWTLRKLGLEQTLSRSELGYAIEANVDIVHAK